MNKFKEQFMIRFVIFFACLLTGIFLIYSLFAYPYEISQRKKTVNHMYEIVRSMEIEEFLEEEQEEEFEFEEEKVDMMIFNSSVQLVFTTNLEKKGKAVSKIIRKDKTIFQENAKAEFYRNVSGEPVAILGKLESEGEEYYIYLYSKTRAARLSIEYTKKIMLWCFLLVFLVGIIFVKNSMGKVVKPLEEIKGILRKLCEKEYSSRVFLPEISNEVSDIAEDVNHLAEILYCNDNTIKNYKFLLENHGKDLDELDVMQKKLVSNMTHQLKTPLAIISSQLELEFQEKSEKQKDYYRNSIMEEIDKMSYLISDILRSSKGRTNPIHVKVYRVCVSELLQEMVLKYKDWLSSREIFFETEIEDGIYAEVDAFQIEQAVNNYMMNACRHTKPGKKVDLRLFKKENVCRIEVHNEGNGIPKEDMEKIWRDYYQRTTKEKNENTNVGLGLCIVKNIIEQHGGEYGVENDDTGVVFWMELKL